MPTVPFRDDFIGYVQLELAEKGSHSIALDGKMLYDRRFGEIKKSAEHYCAGRE